MQKKLKLPDLKGAINGSLLSAIKPLLSQFLPLLLGDVFRLQQPVEKGGLKKEEDDGIISVITTVGDQIILSVHPFNFVETEHLGEGPFLKKPIKSTNLTELITTHLGIQTTTQVIDPLKDEEE